MHDPQTPLPVRLITHNIRYATKHPEPNEPFWATRLPKLSSTYAFATTAHPTAFLCLQEALHTQVTSLLHALNHPSSSSSAPKWAYIGVGRDNGATAGEYAPIFYQPGTWALQRWTTIWLSETPTVPGSKGWDAASVRIATVALFKYAGPEAQWKGRRVVALNTHLDNEGVVARREGARLVRSLVDNWTYHGEGRARVPVFVAGDLNSEPGGEAHAVLDGRGSLVEDVGRVVREEGGVAYGEGCTFTGFQGRKDEQQVLDFLFVGPKKEAAWRLQGYAVLPNCFDDGIMHSDHRAVVADVELM